MFVLFFFFLILQEKGILPSASEMEANELPSALILDSIATHVAILQNSLLISGTAGMNGRTS